MKKVAKPGMVIPAHANKGIGAKGKWDFTYFISCNGVDVPCISYDSYAEAGIAKTEMRKKVAELNA